MLSLLALEGVLRLSGRVRVPPRNVRTDRPELYEAHPTIGYRLHPSRVMTYQYPRRHPRTLTVHANSDGFRDRRDFNSADPRPRLVVLGDSFVFGEGVEEPERFTDRIEALLPEWRVDNLGMTGFGPDLMLRTLEQVGVGLRPTAVLLVLYTDDFRRVRPEYAGAGFEVPRFMLRGGTLATIDYPTPGAWSRLHTVAATRELLWRASGAEWSLNTAILDRIRAIAATEGFALGIAFLPGTSETPTDLERKTWISDYSSRSGTPFLDLTDPILGDRSRHLFIPDNFHLNPDGHAVVADNLVPFLSRSLLTRATP